MIFHPNPRRPPRNYLARREQWRLLALVMSLGLVVILMAQLRQPEARVLLGRVFGLEDTPPAADSREPDVQADEIAALLKDATAAPLPPGTFRSPLPERLPTAHSRQALSTCPWLSQRSSRQLPRK